MKEIALSYNAFSSNVVSHPTLTDFDGLLFWSDPSTSWSIYVKFSIPGTVTLGIEMRSPSGEATISISHGVNTSVVTCNEAKYCVINVCEFQIDKPGYFEFKISGMERAGGYFPDIKALHLEGDPTDKGFFFVPNDPNPDKQLWHFGRRGPSAYLMHINPSREEAEWYYNEVVVPTGHDHYNLYVNVAGFANGYFGLQVKDASTRWVLFSVWDADAPGSPSPPPQEYRVVESARGNEVHVQCFGGEGTGKQAILIYPWMADTVYKFLVRALPNRNDNSTTYTGYFFDNLTNRWRLIASFTRPCTQTYIGRPGSFLENFGPDYGASIYRALIGNTWIKTNVSSTWLELTETSFELDNIGNWEYRMDYQGGLDAGMFYFQICGFFDDSTAKHKVFARPATGMLPNVDLESLPTE